LHNSAAPKIKLQELAVVSNASNPTSEELLRANTSASTAQAAAALPFEGTQSSRFAACNKLEHRQVEIMHYQWTLQSDEIC
jgi:hypothetical protein